MLILDAVGLQIRRSGCLLGWMSLARLDLQSNRNEYKHFKCVKMFFVFCLFISALQMLILDAVGLQIRRSG